VVVPLKIEADSHSAVTTLFPNAKDERHDLGWNTKANPVWSSRQIPQTSYPVPLIALFPDVIERPRYAKKSAGLADAAANVWEKRKVCKHDAATLIQNE
jgi:hypothetical protein